MPLSDEERKVLFDTHAMVKTINERGCIIGIDKIQKVKDNLEKNTREHIWIKGWAYATATSTAIVAYALSMVWKKHGG